MDAQPEPIQEAPPEGQSVRILPPKELTQRALRPGDGSQAAMRAVSNAENALEELSVNFDTWMAKEVSKLHNSRAGAHAASLNGEPLDKLFSVSHDIKGQAGTLGYPVAGDICASLCRLIDARQNGAPISGLLVDQHVDAVRAIMREAAKGRDHPKASALARKLCDVTDDYLIQLSRKKAV